MRSMISMLLFAVLVLTLSLSLTACNTLQGMGRDVEAAGESIQNAANK
ncbi:MAG: entericidin A/B family lipoprotein [bacterium]|nr:entericidin A/B family lipoprotein [bacterium]